MEGIERGREDLESVGEDNVGVHGSDIKMVDHRHLQSSRS